MTNKRPRAGSTNRKVPIIVHAPEPTWIVFESGKSIFSPFLSYPFLSINLSIFLSLTLSSFIFATESLPILRYRPRNGIRLVGREQTSHVPFQIELRRNKKRETKGKEKTVHRTLSMCWRKLSLFLLPISPGFLKSTWTTTFQPVSLAFVSRFVSTI